MNIIQLVQLWAIKNTWNNTEATRNIKHYYRIIIILKHYINYINITKGTWKINIIV